MVRKMRKYEVCRMRQHMYGDPVWGVIAGSQREAIAMTREVFGPGAYNAYPRGELAQDILPKHRRAVTGSWPSMGQK